MRRLEEGYWKLNSWLKSKNRMVEDHPWWKIIYMYIKHENGNEKLDNSIIGCVTENMSI